MKNKDQIESNEEENRNKAANQLAGQLAYVGELITGLDDMAKRIAGPFLLKKSVGDAREYALTVQAHLRNALRSVENKEARFK